MRVIFEVLYKGEEIEVGRADMDLVPGIDEIIHLELTCPPYPATSPDWLATFRVSKRTWEAKNTAKIEGWMHPYTAGGYGGVVRLLVRSEDEPTDAYIDRVRKAHDRQ